MNLPKVTIDYLNNGAVKGGRNQALMLAACQYRDNGANLDRALIDLVQRAVSDGLSEQEARETIKKVYNRSPRAPIKFRYQDRGYEQNGHNQEVYLTYKKQQSQVTIKPRQYDLSVKEPLPTPLNDETRTLLNLAFKEGEGIGIAQETVWEDGSTHPKDGGVVLTREQWLTKLNEVDGDPGKIWRSTAKTGVFIRINPIKAGSSDKDVTAFRHALLEWDQTPIEEQWQLIIQSRIPCTAVIHSGNKSLHAWVRVDAKDYAEYQLRVKQLHDHFEGYKFDSQNKNPSRLSRLPGVTRATGKQALLAVNIGAASWEEWANENEENALPEMKDGVDFLLANIPEPKVIIDGLLHEGEKIVIGGGSKSYKTWALIDLALSVSCGLPWWGRITNSGSVLFINFEIQPFFFQKRLWEVINGKNANLDKGNLSVWNLRGHAADLSQLVPRLIRVLKDRKFSLIIIDPIYKCLGGRDENSAGDMNDLMNEIENFSIQTKASVVFGHHFSKGNQSAKASIDRISGSGVLSRDPDTVLTMTHHEEDNCFSVESRIRNFPWCEPFVVRWKHPLFVPDKELDPSNLKKQKPHNSGQREKNAEILLEVLGDRGLPFKDFKQQASDDYGVSEGSFRTYFSILKNLNKIEKLGNMWVKK